MICNCGGNTESVHKVVRDKVLQGEYQKCPSCGRIMWIWKTDLLEKEVNDSILAKTSFDLGISKSY